MKTKRAFIGILGRRNQGKSALANALCGQEMSIVSATAGTTTDPVRKTMELFGLGPVVLVDTAGIDDDGLLGEQRIRKSVEAIKMLDTALLVISHNRFGDYEELIVKLLNEYCVPFVIVHNKSDEEKLTDLLRENIEKYAAPVLECSAQTGEGIAEVRAAIVSTTPASVYQPDVLVGDLVRHGDEVLLVMPQDEEAPEGRLILPQVQVIRDILDHHAVASCVQTAEVSDFLSEHHPQLVISDSQVFGEVSKLVAETIPLTSFSIILSRAKGDFEQYLAGTPKLSSLRDGDRILMLESCSHAVSCGDIGHHKIPSLMQKTTGKQLVFDFVASLEPLPEDLSQYAMAIQCGGCMATKKQLQNRIGQLVKSGVPVSNYGMTIAYLTGIFNRVTAPFASR